MIKTRGLAPLVSGQEKTANTGADAAGSFGAAQLGALVHGEMIITLLHARQAMTARGHD